MYEFDYSSPSLLNEYLWYDKLWGPSQRVVTLLILVLWREQKYSIAFIFLSREMINCQPIYGNIATMFFGP